jgi:hypothetical protein
MNRVIIYTSNPNFKPTSLEQLVAFAKGTPKFYIAEVGLNAYLSDVKIGDHLVTKKGNDIYVLNTFDKPVDQLSGEDAAYVDELTRKYNLTKCNITSVANRIKFETWCATARPLLQKEETNKTNKANMKNSIKNFAERLKAQFYPQQADDVRIAIDGNICVETSEGYVAIDDNFHLISYPSEMVIDVPAYTIARSFDQLKEGDVILRTKSYGKIKSIKDGKITVVGYTGCGSNVYPIKDFLLGQATVRVVVSYTGVVDGQINPLMLFMLSGDKKNDSLLPLMMLNQTGGNITQNPMMLALLAGKDDSFDLKDIMLFSMVNGGQNPFAGLFGGVGPKVVAQAPVENDED